VVHLDLGGEYRGGQRQVIYLAVEQVRAGMDVRIAAPAGTPILQAATERKIPVLVLPQRRDFHPLNLVILYGSLPPRIILHTHDARSASLGALISLLRHDLILVHTRRVSYPLGRAWSRWKYHRASLVICVSREVEETVRVAGVRFTMVIPSSIVTDRYPSRLHGNGGRLGVIGALSPQKGHAQLFEALALMSDPPEVWIVGKGELETELRAQAVRLGLGERIVWKGEIESPLVLSHLDILAVPSIHGEGSSGVIKEAWASGVPVVCSDLPANRELVRHNDNGLLFRNGDPVSLAVQLAKLQADLELGRRLAEQGRADVAAFDVTCMHTFYLQAYSAALAVRV
jgi:glycosyltransferase involved in cell wall biosynthesis